MMILENKIALVTGGSRGIGRAIAVALAEARATTIVNFSSSEKPAQEVQQKILQTGGKAITRVTRRDRNHAVMSWRKTINKTTIGLSCALVAFLVVFLPLVATAQTQPETTAQAQPENQSRRERGNQVINKLSGGAGQPVLNALRQDFPFLGDAIIDYSLGDVWSRTELDDRTRQLAAVAAFAAQGSLPQLKIHAGYALRLGVTQNELKEIVALLN